MEKLISEVEGKLVEYDINIYDHHPIENGEYVFVAEDMIIYAREKDNSITVAFQATTKPDVVANNILLLLEIDSLVDIDITDSFIFDENKKLIFGNEAFDLIKQSVKMATIKDFSMKKELEDILLNTENCHEC